MPIKRSFSVSSSDVVVTSKRRCTRSYRRKSSISHLCYKADSDLKILKKRIRRRSQLQKERASILVPEPIIVLVPEPEPIIALALVPEPIIVLVPEPEPIIVLALVPEPIIVLALVPEPTIDVVPEPEPIIVLALVPEPEPIIVLALVPEPEPIIALALVPEPEHTLTLDTSSVKWPNAYEDVIVWLDSDDEDEYEHKEPSLPNPNTIKVEAPQSEIYIDNTVSVDVQMKNLRCVDRELLASKMELRDIKYDIGKIRSESSELKNKIKLYNISILAKRDELRRLTLNVKNIKNSR